VPLSVSSLKEFGQLKGTVEIFAGSSVVCGCFVSQIDGEPDWLVFYLPLGALARVEPAIGGYPFGEAGGDSSLNWRRRLDNWLASVGINVFSSARFQAAMIGFEVYGEFEMDELKKMPPNKRRVGYLLAADDQVRYEPANR